MERSTCLGGFGAVCDEGYGISYIVVGEDQGMYLYILIQNYLLGLGA